MPPKVSGRFIMILMILIYILSHHGFVGNRSPLNLILFFFFVFCLFRAASTAYGGCQARGLIGTVATGLRHSHSNVGSKSCLQPTSQLTATLDP